jgi:uncharacterized protein (TIGR02300 family)
VAKAELGTKRTCPKCGNRFYDLGNDSPIVCIDCGESWKHEPILKARPSVVAKPEKKKPEVEKTEDEDDEASLIDEAGIILDADDDDDDNSDDDSVIAEVSLDSDDENLDKVVAASITKSDD